MGNCTSGIKRKRKEDSTADNKYNTDAKPTEDVTYASIDHSAAKGLRRPRAASQDDCDYAVVFVPPALQPREPEGSARGDCDDDYVLMS